MTDRRVAAAAFLALSITWMGCASRPSKGPEPAPEPSVGGVPAVTLRQTRDGNAKIPSFVSAVVLPGRGMNTFQIRAYVPGKGDIDLLQSPALPQASTILNGGADDQRGNQSFSLGGAILLPFANRITGQLSPDRSSLETQVQGKPVRLPANWRGKYAMHGLMLAAAMQDVRQGSDATGAWVEASLQARDFGGKWPSQTNVKIRVTLKSESFELNVTATNAGQEPLPMGIGWRPYFVLPSGDRKQARLHVPARGRALVNNYDDVLPTGVVQPVLHTPYDLLALGGAPLRELYLDDCFVDLQKDHDRDTVAEISDPAAHYGLRITAVSHEVQAIQVYAPVDKNFIVLQPQFNLTDPYSPVWKRRNTGMDVLRPGQSVSYIVRLVLFQP